MLYAKPIGVVIIAVITAIVAALTNNSISPQEWVIVVGVGLSAVGSAIVPNLPAGIASYAKSIVTFLVAGAATLAVLVVGGLTTAEVLEVLIAAAASVGIVVAAPGPVTATASSSTRYATGGTITPAEGI
jgi:uncharacterized membrane protein YhhN